MKLLRDLGDKARLVGRGAAGIFDAGALRELSIGLIRGNCFMYHACVGHVSGVSHVCQWSGVCGGRTLLASVAQRGGPSVFSFDNYKEERYTFGIGT
jgi:hypothetical protein